MNEYELFRETTTAFENRLAAVDDQWGQPTPAAEWDVRALVNHVAGEMRWMPALLGGDTVAGVGDRFDGDLLGDDPKATWAAAVADARHAADETDPDKIVHLSYGDVPARAYVNEVASDVLIHTWDLARATGGDERLPADAVDHIAQWFAGVEDAWRGAGVIGPRAAVAEDADPQTRLLAAFGRDAESGRR